MRPGCIKIRIKLLWTRSPRSNFGKNIFSNNLINSAYEVWNAVCGRASGQPWSPRGRAKKQGLWSFKLDLGFSDRHRRYYFSLVFHIIFIIFLHFSYNFYNFHIIFIKNKAFLLDFLKICARALDFLARAAQNFTKLSHL